MTNQPDRTPPFSAEAEEHVLACCLLDGGETINRAVMAGITTDSFFDPKNAVLWSNIIHIHNNTPPVTLEVLGQRLTDTKELDKVGGFAHLMQVTGKIPTTAHAGYFIDKVREKEVLRRVIKTCTERVEKAYSFTGGLDDFISEGISSMISIQDKAAQGKEISVADAAKRAEEEFRARMEGKKIHKEHVQFGFSDLDNIFHPMMAGEMVVIAARPSVGKTSLTDQIALHNAIRMKQNVVVFSLEEKTTMKPSKYAQMISGHSARAFDKLPKEHKEEFLDTLAMLRQEKSLHVFYKHQTLGSILARIRSMHGSGKCDLAIIDYLQLMSIPGFKNDRLAALTEATRMIKLTANELDIPIIVLSQLNRASARENREPQLFDLRESGSIEQDADRVIFIHRPSMDAVTGEVQDITDQDKSMFYQELIQAKGRSVGTFRVGMYFNRPITCFKQIDKASFKK